MGMGRGLKQLLVVAVMLVFFAIILIPEFIKGSVSSPPPPEAPTIPTPFVFPSIRPRPTPSASPSSGSIEKTPVDIKDKANYFIMIDGVRFDIGMPVKDFFAAGFSLSDYSFEYWPEEVAAGDSVGIAVRYKGSESFIGAAILNDSGEIKPPEECQISAFTNVDKSFFGEFPSLSIAGGITIGSSIEELETVFGQCGSIGNSIFSSEYRDYRYKVPEVDRELDFIFSDGKIISRFYLGKLRETVIVTE